MMTEHSRKLSSRDRVSAVGGWLLVAFAATLSACGDSGSGPGDTATRGSWQQISGGVGESEFRAVWGTSSDTLLAAGGSVGLASAISGRWSPVDLPIDSTSLNAIWARSPDDIYVAGRSGAAFHFDGDTWSATPATESVAILDLCGAPSGELFAVTDGASVLKHANNTWELVANTFPELCTIWVTDAQKIYVAGVDGYVGRYDGNDWLPVSRVGGFKWFDSWGTSSDDVFFVGADGHIARYFFALTEQVSPVATSLYSISGNASNYIFAVGDEGTIVHFNGFAWSIQTPVTSRNLRAVHVFDDGRAVALGEYGTVLEFDGQVWHLVIEGQPETLIDASGVDAEHVFFAGRDQAGDGLVRHIDGRTWTFAGERVRGIWATGTDEALVVGTNGMAHRFDGSQWVPMTNGAISHLNSVSGSQGVRAFAVGDNGNLRYSNAPFTAWSAMVPPIDAIFNIRDVWVAAPDNVFAIGPDGRVLRYQGAPNLHWTSEQTGLVGAEFTAIAGWSATDVAAVANDGRVFHYDGSNWREIPAGLHAPWADIATGPSATLAAVSLLPSTVMISSFDLGDFKSPAYLGPFHAAWISPGTAYVAGEQGSIFRFQW